MSNWSGLGGPDKEVSIYGRQSNSGTYIYFQDNVLKGDYSPKARRMNGTAQIVEAIKTDTAGIGYVGIGYAVGDEGEVVSGIKVLKIARDETTPAVSPLEPENVMSGLYPLSRPLYQFTNGRPEGRLLEFIRFELSEKGQAIVGEQGSYPVTPDYIKQNKSVAADLHP
jgi:phosphate transport system substrate-binding protein